MNVRPEIGLKFKIKKMLSTHAYIIKADAQLCKKACVCEIETIKEFSTWHTEHVRAIQVDVTSATLADSSLTGTIN